MKGFELLICVYFFKFSDASLSWSKSYTLKAVLTVPGANLSEPYEVWVNGDTGNSRVDFYNGMDKLYREWDDISEKFIYYKIHPENTKTYTSIDVCHTINAAASETKMYALNTYLPVKNFVFKHNDILNGAETQKWEAYFLLDPKMNSSVTYTMWVQFKKTPNSDNATVPVRYIFEMKIGDNLLDYFRHDYSYYDDTEPGISVVNKLLGIQCKPLEMTEESIDPLMEYVEPQLEQSRVNTVFHRFKKIHNKNYKNENEHFRRLNIFKNNLRYINSINRQHGSFSVGLNHLADLTDEEMLVFLGTIRYPKSDIDNSYKDHTEDISNNYEYDNDDDDFVDDDIKGDNVKARFDWREYGAITPIKDQTALCASCYAFTTAAVVESAAYIARGCKNLVELSEQVLVDCTWNAGYGNLGCAGGTYEDTLDWVRTNGIPTKEEYGPYLALEGRCHIKNMTKFVTIQRHESIPGVTHIIKKALRKKGPLLASINTSPRSFTLYTGGVYNDPACRSEPLMRTHSVTLVGYGREGAQKYWLLKNSYGTGWGEQGYMKLAIEDCRCGLQNYVRAVVNSNSKIKECTKEL